MLTEAEIKSVYPPTPMQHGILKNAFFSSNSYSQHTQLVLPLKGPIDLLLFEHCWQEVINRYDALRSRFIHKSVANPVQTIPYYEILHIRQYPLETSFNPITSPDALPSEIKHYLANDLIQAFDLESMQPMRLAIFSLYSQHQWLVWSFHKIVLDNRSVNLVLQEVFECYNAFKISSPLKFDPNNNLAQYVQWLSNQDKNNSLAYWKKQLGSFNENHLLNFRKPHHRTYIETKFDTKLFNQIHTFEKQHNVSLHNILLSTWALTIGHYLGQHDVIIPMMLSGRPAAIEASNEMVGQFTNIVPLRVRWNDQINFYELTQLIKRSISDAEENQYIPISDICSINKKLAIDHIFQIDSPILKDIIGKQFFGIEVGKPTINENIGDSLKISFVTTDTEINLHLIGNYDESWLQSMVESFIHILYTVIQTPYKPLHLIDFIDAKQRHLLMAWGDGGPAPTHSTLLELFDEQLCKMPDAPAIIYNNITISYDELDKKSNRLANSMLQDHTFHHDSTIAIIGRRNIDTIIALLAALKTGSAYLVIDPDLSVTNIKKMLQLSSCRYVLSSANTLEKICLPDNINKSDLHSLCKEASDKRPHIYINPDSLAYCVFKQNFPNSEKCVAIKHSNISAFLATLPESFFFLPGDRMLASTKISLDKSTLELLGALCCGMTIVLASESQIENLPELLDLIHQQQVNVMQMTSGTLQFLLKVSKDKRLGNIHTILLGGSNLSPQLAHELLGYKDIRVFNMYGFPETTIWSTYWPLSEGPVSIGRPLPGERIFILSHENRLLPPGAIGQIAIAGSGICRGYINKANKSCRDFITLPNVDGHIYLTGNIGYWRKDGSLEVVGTLNPQTKVRRITFTCNDDNYKYKHTRQENIRNIIGMRS